MNNAFCFESAQHVALVWNQFLFFLILLQYTCHGTTNVPYLYLLLLWILFRICIRLPTQGKAMPFMSVCRQKEKWFEYIYRCHTQCNNRIWTFLYLLHKSRRLFLPWMLQGSKWELWPSSRRRRGRYDTAFSRSSPSAKSRRVLDQPSLYHWLHNENHFILGPNPTLQCGVSIFSLKFAAQLGSQCTCWWSVRCSHNCTSRSLGSYEMVKNVLNYIHWLRLNCE